jgi:hypothetical protein
MQIKLLATEVFGSNDFAAFCCYAYMMNDLVRGLGFKDAK